MVVVDCVVQSVSVGETMISFSVNWMSNFRICPATRAVVEDGVHS